MLTTEGVISVEALYGFLRVRWDDASGVGRPSMGQPAPRPEFLCSYCSTVSAWRAGDAPPRKCWACGAPRQE